MFDPEEFIAQPWFEPRSTTPQIDMMIRWGGGRDPELEINLIKAAQTTALQDMIRAMAETEGIHPHTKQLLESAFDVAGGAPLDLTSYTSEVES